MDCCEDATRFLKTLIAFLLASIACGLAFQAKHEVNIMMRMVTKRTGIVAFLSNGFTMSFGFMYIVNCGCVLYSLLGLSCIRYCIFRERENESAKCRAIQMCLGPCCATYHQIMVSISLGLQVGVSYFWLLFSVLLGTLLIFCKGGNTAISSLQGFFDEMHSRNSYQPGAFNPMNAFMNLNVNKYCMATRGMNHSVLQCFGGCILSVASQVLMVMVISEEKGRIEGTMAEGAIFDKTQKKKNKRRKGSSSSSSSSSSSDDETPKAKAGTREHDPLRQYVDKVPANGGRNYKLPGGNVNTWNR